MNNFKYLYGLIDFSFFEIPKNNLKNKFLALKYGYSKNKIEEAKPFVYLANRASEIDKSLLANTFKFDFLFLKDSVVRDINFGRFGKEKTQILLKNFEILREYHVSVVIFPENHCSVLGEVSSLSPNFCALLAKLESDIKILSIIGTFFAYPVWASAPRRCNTSFKVIHTLYYENFKNLSLTELTKKIDETMPSSASTQARHFALNLFSDKLADGLETVAYCCPNCNSLLSLYSEYNCLKCRNCSSAIEFASDGSLLLNKNIRDLDSLSAFQFNLLSKIKNSKNHLFYFDKVCKCSRVGEKFYDIANVSLKVYKTKFEIEQGGSVQEIKFNNLLDLALLKNNTLMLCKRDGEILYIRGRDRQCMYILCDLYKLSINKNGK